MGGVLLVLTLLLAVFLGWRYQQQRALADAGEDAEKAGVAAATNMLTYDYKTLDEDFAWVQDDGTKTFQQSENANAIRWGTTYNFWFDAEGAPGTADAALARFKPGPGPASFALNVQAPRG